MINQHKLMFVNIIACEPNAQSVIQLLKQSCNIQTVFKCLVWYAEVTDHSGVDIGIFFYGF